MNIMNNLFLSLRPWQWIKNLLIFIPYLLTTNSFDFILVELLFAFLLFSLFVSSTYLLNDVKDKEVDILHPKKRGRPIASGSLTVKNAKLSAFSIITFVILSSLFINQNLIIFIFIYGCITYIYSNYTKYIYLLDTLSISSMFLIRIFIGGEIAKINITPYLALFIFFTSCILSISKKLSIINSIDKDNKNSFVMLLRSQNEKFSFKKIYVIFSIFASASFIAWLINISNIFENLIYLIFAYLFYLIFKILIYRYSKVGHLEDFSYEIFNHKLLLLSSLLFLFMFYLGYF